MSTHLVPEDWFCTDCGRGPREMTRFGEGIGLWTESHAPSCQGRHDPDAIQGPRKYGKTGG